MRTIKLTILSFVLACPAVAQTSDDPVLMRIGGQPVLRSEFEYSYNKNGDSEGVVEEKTIDEYKDMYINYKLKVLAAEDAKYDTAASFKKEFLTYRDMQLTPYMVDEEYIDSVARDIHTKNTEYLAGRQLIEPAHILFTVRASEGEAKKAAVRAKADSVYQALLGGADFGEMAQKYSDDKSSAVKGGQLPLMPPQPQLKEMMEAVDKLEVGEMSPVIEAPYGFQIVKLTNRKPYGSYEEVAPELKEQLRKQTNIEDESAEHKIQKIVAASNGHLTREMVLDSVLAAHSGDKNLQYLVQEYHDGLLLYEAQKDAVWTPAKTDTQALEKQFKDNKKKYAWSEPRFKGFVFHCKDKKMVKPVSKALKKAGEANWKTVVKEQFNKDSVQVQVAGPYLCKKGENRFIDEYAFGGSPAKENPKYPYSGVVGKKLSQPQSYSDVQSLVEADVQEAYEKRWIESLRAKYPVEVDEAVLKTVNKH